MRKKDEERRGYPASTKMSSSSSRKLLCIVIILLLFLGIALTAAGIAVYLHYMGNRKEAKETQSYMRSLINQINTAADVRWKVCKKDILIKFVSFKIL